MPESRTSVNINPVLILFILTALGIGIIPNLINRSYIPPHLSNHASIIKQNLVPEETAAELITLMKELGEYHSNVNQGKGQGFTPTYEEIGESVAINADGTCSHNLLFPNKNKTRCILPERVDIGKHFVMTGGLDGVKENFQDLVDRVSSFGRYTFSKDSNPAVKSLFESEDFQSAAKSICPKDAPFLDPFQFNFIIQVPGQTVAVHIDAPYFWGADRYHFPQWLLAVMLFSGLYEDIFVHQVQVVAYLHDWAPNQGTKKIGGQFAYYINSTAIEIVDPLPLSGSFIDGSKMLHAAKIYQPDVKVPHIDKDKETILKFTGGENWEIQSDGVTIKRYSTSELRLSLVYRAKCFASKDEAQRFAGLGKIDMLSLESVLEKLSANLVKKNRVSAEKLRGMSKLDLAFTLIDSYIVYPLPPVESAFIPYNYCALQKLYPWTKYFLDFLCS